VSLTDEEIGRVIRAALSQGASSPKASTTKPKAKRTPAKKKRKPSAYNQYMAKELAKLKKKHPRTKISRLMRRAHIATKKVRK